MPFDRAKITTIRPNVHLIDDAGESTCYLVCGSQRALLIDTVNGMEDLRAVTRSLTDLPVTVVIPEAARGASFYAIARHHVDVDGNESTELIDDVQVDTEKHTITFMTDRFSTYAIVYEGALTGTVEPVSEQVTFTDKGALQAAQVMEEMLAEITAQIAAGQETGLRDGTVEAVENAAPGEKAVRLALYLSDTDTSDTERMDALEQEARTALGSGSKLVAFDLEAALVRENGEVLEPVFLSEPVPMELNIPEAAAGAANYAVVRAYWDDAAGEMVIEQLARVFAGRAAGRIVTERLAGVTFDRAAGTISFEADRTGTYAIVYEGTYAPAAGGQTSGSAAATATATAAPAAVTPAPLTGDAAQPALYAAVCLAALCALAVVSRKRSF